MNFCAFLFKRTQNVHYPKNSEKKKCVNSALSKLCLQKLHQFYLGKYVCKILYDSMRYNLRQNYHKSFGKNEILVPPTELYVPKLRHYYI